LAYFFVVASLVVKRTHTQASKENPTGEIFEDYYPKDSLRGLIPDVLLEKFQFWRFGTIFYFMKSNTLRQYSSWIS
jgi:hypothetical protein